MSRPPLATPKKPPEPSVYTTGFCIVGNHFGSKNYSVSGLLLPACKHEYFIDRIGRIECMCWCHDTERQFREMARAMGREVAPIESSERSVLAAPSLRDAVGVAVKTVSDPAPGADPNRADVTILPGGRAERGELERLTWTVVCDALDGKLVVPDDGITPKFISFEITLRTLMAYSPSTGAVAAVLERWAKVMRCHVLDKPLRVTSLDRRMPPGT